MPKNNFEIGDIVTLKSHPLAFETDGRMDTAINHIPPFMCIKEVHFERNKLKYSKELPDTLNADNVKYICTYFNQHRMLFEDQIIYQKMLISINDITFHSESKSNNKDHITLVEETNLYEIANYEFGKRVFFKTHKLEKRKKFRTIGFDSKSNKTIYTHTSPAFILNGIKLNEDKSVFDEKKGKLLKKCSDQLYKVLWYNSYQEKMSQGYFPQEFFVDNEKIHEILKYSESKQ
ncbi:hypothetical protein [Croceibacter atlanticus]|uniref:hypothetical protein n=1 Tax=Croceibacter atlanticus TaxID=313588 RepID=UPI0030FC4680